MITNQEATGFSLESSRKKESTYATMAVLGCLSVWGGVASFASNILSERTSSGVVIASFLFEVSTVYAARKNHQELKGLEALQILETGPSQEFNSTTPEVETYELAGTHNAKVPVPQTNELAPDNLVKPIMIHLPTYGLCG